MGEPIISIVVSRVLVCEEVLLEFTFEKEGNKMWRYGGVCNYFRVSTFLVILH